MEKKTETNDVYREIKKETTLQNLYGTEEVFKASLFAIILDITPAFHLESNGIMALKLKVIDETFNSSIIQQKSQFKYQKFAQVVFMASQIEELPKISHFGDIIRLRRFCFKTTREGDLIGHENAFSNWMLIGLNDGEIIQGKYKKAKQYDGQQSMIRDQMREHLYSGEQIRLQALQKWAKEFFQNNSIERSLWWNYLEEPNDLEEAYQNQILFKNVDLVLQVQQLQKFTQQERNYIKYQLLDQKKNQYILQVEGGINVEDSRNLVMKFRSINIKFLKNGIREIRMSNDISSCLKVYDQFYSSQIFLQKKHLPKLKNKLIQGGYNTKRCVLKKYNFLEDFYFEEILLRQKTILENPNWYQIYCLQGTMIKKQFFNQKPTYLKDIKMLQVDKLEENLFQKFVFQINIQSLEFNENSIFCFCQKCKKFLKLLNFKELQCCQQNLDILILMKMIVNDSSLKQKESVQIYISLKQNNQDFFQMWQILPDLNDFRKWAALNDIILNKFNQKIKLFIDSVKNFSIVCELKKSLQHKIYFLELCDTIFLPQIIISLFLNLWFFLLQKFNFFLISNKKFIIFLVLYFSLAFIYQLYNYQAIKYLLIF